jgi:hypothetical protein
MNVFFFLEASLVHPTVGSGRWGHRLPSSLRRKIKISKRMEGLPLHVQGFVGLICSFCWDRDIKTRGMAYLDM